MTEKRFVPTEPLLNALAAVWRKLSAAIDTEYALGTFASEELKQKARSLQAEGDAALAANDHDGLLLAADGLRDVVDVLKGGTPFKGLGEIVIDTGKDSPDRIEVGTCGGEVVIRITRYGLRMGAISFPEQGATAIATMLLVAGRVVRGEGSEEVHH